MSCRFAVLCVAILLFFFGGMPFYAASQPKQGQARIDSLLGRKSRMKDDTAGVKLLNEIAYGYRLILPDSGIAYARQELALAQKLGWQPGEASAYNDLGNNFLNQSNYPAALDNFFRSLKIDEALGAQKLIGVVSGNIGMVYWRQLAYPKALSYMSRAVALAKATGNKRGEQLALGNIGAVYADSGNVEKALEYALQSLAIAKELDDKSGIIIQSCNIGTEYKDLRAYSRALQFQFESLRLAQATGDRQFFGINAGNIGQIYLAIAKDSILPGPDSLIPAGRSANLAQAVTYLRKGIETCGDLDFKQGVSEFSLSLSEACALSGDYAAALAAHQQYTAAKDAMFSSETNEQIANLETKRALELKDKDIQIAKLAVAKKRNERVFFIAGIVLLLFIVGILARNFRRQRHSNILLSEEKKRSDDLLLNILPAEVAEELKNNGESAARLYEEVSVLFTDFVNFTNVGETLSPQVLVKELHECFTAFDAIIERNGLEKIKTIGDAYMAVCGLPLADPMHAIRCVQAALEIRDFIEERRKQEQVFEIRIGINSGPVVAGIVGVKKFAFDIWGDTVNTAARMEQCGVAGQVNISQRTYELVKDHYQCTHRGRIPAKNKGEVAMYFAEARSAAITMSNLQIVG